MLMTQSTNSNEDNRDNVRLRTFLGGRIFVNHQRSTIDCLVRNKSDTGCQLVVESQLGIPDGFSLQLNNGKSFDCSVVWREKDKIGVKFIDE